MATCCNCGHELIWQSDFMRSEYVGADLDDEQDSVVGVWECPMCHTMHFAVHPSNEELKEYGDN